MRSVPNGEGRTFLWLAAAISFGILGVSHAQTTSVVQSLGVVPASQPVAGLGFNINPSTEKEFQIAAVAGATHARFQCGWESTETQSAPPTNTNGPTKYVLSNDCQNGMNFSKKYGIHPTLIAAYGPPSHQILSVSIPAGASAGSFTLTVQFASGVNGTTLAKLAPFYDLIIGPNNTQISSRHSYPGVLVVGVQLIDATHATLTLSSALTAAIQASKTSLFTINEYLYPPAARTSAADPSVIAFTNYARFLAQCISNAGLTGDVEIWNEPVWGDDRWDVRANSYDVFPTGILPGPQIPDLANFGFVAALQSQTPVSGVTYTWAGTNKSGDLSVLDWRMKTNTGVAFAEPAVGVTAESLHPYGNNPEDALWNEICMKSTIHPYPQTPDYFFACNIDINSTTNAGAPEQESLVQKSVNPIYGIAHSITETGFGLVDGDQAHQTRFDLRQYLGYQAAGVTPIDFYRLNSSDNNLTFTAPGTYAPYQSLTALSGLMSDLAKIKNAPVATYTLASLSSISSYSGTYPLDTMHMVGTRSGDTANSEIFALWQRSNIVQPGRWGLLASPAAVSVTIKLPVATSVSAIVNLTTRVAVPYTTAAQTATFKVSDDPIEVFIIPTPVTVTVTSIALSPAAISVSVGSTVSYVCTATLSNGTTSACASPVYSSSNLAINTISGNVATAVKPGSSTIKVVAGGFSASASLTVNAMPATITIGNLSHTYNGTPQPVTATTSPSGIAYTVTYSGLSLVPTGAGSYLVVATITDPNYTGTPARGTLVIAKATPVISWTPASNSGTFGVGLDGTVLDATSSVPGTFIYTATNNSTNAQARISVGTTLASGTYTIGCSFNPTDGNDYTTASGSIGYTIVNRTVFVVNQAGSVASFYANGAVQSDATPGGGLGAVVDPSGNVWSVNASGAGLSKFDHTGFLLSTVSGFSAAKALTVDGAGRVWIVSSTGSLWNIAPSGLINSSAPVTSVGLYTPSSISVDSSGSLWVTNSGGNSVTEIFGGATPVVTPIVAESMSNQ